MKKLKNRLVTDLKKLTQAIPVTEFKPKEAEVIAAGLFTELSKHKGLGLSANQMGIDKRICVINAKEPFYLENPRIIETSDELYTYIETCLSIPKSAQKPIKTVRHLEIVVEADNFEGQLQFGPDDVELWSSNPYAFWQDKGFLECVVVQHEIDHLNGITIKDRNQNLPSISTKQDRNKKYMFKSPTGDMEYIKYKFGAKLLEAGWEVT